VLREGTPEDVLAYIDGALLVDLWDSLVLPRDVQVFFSLPAAQGFLLAGGAALVAQIPALRRFFAT